MTLPLQWRIPSYEILPSHSSLFSPPKKPYIIINPHFFCIITPLSHLQSNLDYISPKKKSGSLRNHVPVYIYVLHRFYICSHKQHYVFFSFFTALFHVGYFFTPQNSKRFSGFPLFCGFKLSTLPLQII